MAKLDVKPFRVAVTDAEIADLRERLARTRWPDQIPGTGWDYGTDRTYLRELCDYWGTRFDWRAFENRFNAFAQFTTEIDAQRLHFLHVRSPEPHARPLIITHGWPGSVAEFLDILGPLADPAAHGGNPSDAFHVVAPSIPGYGFSGPTHERGYGAARIARTFDALMQSLGYGAYFAHGGDLGTRITILLAAQFPERVKAIHTNIVSAPPPDPANPQAGLTQAELDDLAFMAAFAERETAYQKMQGTKPQTLSYGLTDSPAGLAAWIVEKFQAWCDCGGSIENAVRRDRLLDNISVYWLTGTINSSMRLYYEDRGGGPGKPLPAFAAPLGHARFPGEIVRVPRAWVAAKYNLVHWSVMPRGGHFAAMEVPDLLVDDLRAYFRMQRHLMPD